MKYYSYVITRDFGFAPNPFGKYCTLATCKPKIRKSTSPGDWIIGITSKKLGNKLLFAMCVNKKITFNEYWNDPIFQYKKPIMNGSLKKMYGDNIYFFDDEKNEWHQENSHHSLEDGKTNYLNLNKDTPGKYVLISDEFFYFGSEYITIPHGIKKHIIVGIGHKIIKPKFGTKLLDWLKSKYEYGYYADPILFRDFKRYDGK